MAETKPKRTRKPRLVKVKLLVSRSGYNPDGTLISNKKGDIVAVPKSEADTLKAKGWATDV